MGKLLVNKGCVEKTELVDGKKSSKKVEDLRFKDKEEGKSRE